MRLRGALSLVAFAVIIVFAFRYFMAMGVRVGPPPQRANVSMRVQDIDGLVVGSSVQLRGVPIGEISHIGTTMMGATVNFYIDSRYQIPVDTDVRLENLSALGESYIELVPHSEGGPVWHDGQRLDTTAITQRPSISELAETVVRVLNQLDPNALENVVNEGDSALPNPVKVLPNLARAATLVRDTAANMDGKGRDLLDNFQTLFRNADFVGPVLSFNTPYITRIGRDLDSIYSCVAEGYNRGGPETIKNFAHFVARVEHLLDHSSGDIKVLLQSMLPYVNDISGALMNLDTRQVFENMLAAVPEDGAVTLHVTIPPGEAAGNPTTDTPTTPSAPEVPAPQVSAPTAPPHATPQSAAADAATTTPDASPESILPIPPCHPVFPTATKPAPHADATPRRREHAAPAPATPGS